MKPRAWTYKFPIPRGHRNVIAFVFEMIMTNSEYYELADMLLSGLTATEIALAAHLLGITEKFLYANKYLNPLREQDPFMIYFGPLIQKKLRVLILGEGVSELIQRIQFPAEYWSSRLQEVETNGGIIPPPEIWIVAIPPNKLTHDIPTMSAASEESFDMLVFPVESEYMFRDSNTSMAVMLMKGTGIFLRFRHPQPDTQWSKYLCTTGSISCEIDWDDLYKDIHEGSSLPYINASEEPHTIRFSENDPTVKSKLDIHNEYGSMVLWKRLYSLPPNYLFTGRALDDNGRDMLDEVELAFRFPFRKI
ncbi:uncharacterized protein N7506_003199 [Penicillium brevicompactum]|uniref:uncharacterized protein n=1 Tax=Penicillium brevicompactum TaxID=5074 RepID=UPI0025405C82|nr:uncharacterized protein N7506_003199 [Penicillium brevicompactum]KAJ5343375.1 hypothetical protein N7506_003199 [Penicillium brevicompactum]